MQQFASQLPVFVTASPEGDAIGRELVADGVSLVGATGTLAQLRRALVRGNVRTPTVLCITLDDATLRRHGEMLKIMLDDRCSFPTPMHAIGLLHSKHPPIGWESLGCDSIARTTSELQSLLTTFDQRSMAEGNRFSFTSTADLLLEEQQHHSGSADTHTRNLRWRQRRRCDRQ